MEVAEDAADAEIVEVAADAADAEVTTTRVAMVSNLAIRTISRGRKLPLKSHRAAISLLKQWKRRKKRPYNSSETKEEVETSRPAKIREIINSPKTQGPRQLSKLRQNKRRSQRSQLLSKIVAGVQLCFKQRRTRVKLKIVLHNRLHLHRSLREVKMLEALLGVVLHAEAAVAVAEALVAPQEVAARSLFVLTTSS